MGEVVYQLTFTLANSGGSFTVNHKTKAQVKLSGADKGETSLALTGLSYVKKIYYPGEIKAELALENLVPDTASLKKYFSGAVVSMSISGGNNVADKYLVADCSVEKRNSAGTLSTYLQLKICSPDYKFEAVKYSKAHTGRRLGDVIEQAAKDFGVGAVTKNFCFLSHKRPVGNSNETVDDELIQPYMVQYNETFYSFARRMANRCGEFLYFEDGTFNLGLAQSSVLNVNLYCSLSFHDYKRSSPAGVNYSHRNPIDDTKLSAGSKGSYNIESAYDEYLKKMTYDGYDTVKAVYDARYSDYPSEIAASVFNATSLIQGLTNLGFSQAKAWALSGNISSRANEKYNKNYFDPSKKYYESGSTEKFYGYYDRIKGKSDGEVKEFTQFSTHPSQNVSTIKRNIDSALFKLVLENQRKVLDKRVEIDLGANLSAISLGRRICFPGKDGNKNYIVVEVSGGRTEDSEWKEYMKLVAVPDLKSDTQPSIPPPLKEGHVLRSGPQAARISASTYDPEHLGRVRVRFSWQNDSDDQSPWIRVSTLNATDGGGSYFQPEEGDECILDFECENIERPYVIGYLHNDKHEPRYGTRTYSDVISNGGGQTIRMFDSKDDTGFWAGVLPVLSLIRNLAPISNDKGKFRKVSGFTEITDEFGVFNVKMSSAERRVTINSPFGSVDASAFTGITLNAPNGDVKIIGKNIDIKAGNNINLTSGANISNQYQLHSLIWGSKKLGSALVNPLIDNLAKEFLDLSLLRCIVETFMRPVAGNFTIRSNRYLLMSAGKGNANLPVEAYDSQWGTGWSLNGEKPYWSAKVLSDIQTMVTKFDKLFNDRKLKAEALAQKVEAYNVQFLNLLREGENKYSVQTIINSAGQGVSYNENATSMREQILRERLQVSDTQIDSMQQFAAFIHDVAANLLQADASLPGTDLQGTFCFPDKVMTAFNGIPATNKSHAFTVNELGNNDNLLNLPGRAPDANVRRLIWTFLKQFKGAAGGPLGMIFPAQDPNFDSPDSWNAKLSEIMGSDSNAGLNIFNNLVAKLKESFASVVMNPFKERCSWSADNKGEIIMSQKADKVIRFTERGPAEANPSSLEGIIDACRTLGARDQQQ